jgi:protease secretion system membrane fusion protein
VQATEVNQSKPSGVSAQAPVRRANRIGVIAVVVSFTAFLLWASFAPLAQGVSSPGTIVVETRRKQVQHLSGGIVREILVREGQEVAQDEVLMRLEGLQTKAGHEAALQQYLGLRAQESRLIAERDNASVVSFHPSLSDPRFGPAAERQRLNQESLFAARRNTRSLDLQAADEAIAGLRASLAGTEGPLNARRVQEATISKELGSSRELASAGFLPLQRVRELERSLEEVRGGIVDLEANRKRLEQGIAEQFTRRDLKIKEFRREVDQQIAEVQKEVEAAEERLKASDAELARIDIRAPVAGQVVGLATQTVGGVVTGSQKLMEIVPRDEELLIEAKVPPNFIDRVKAGQAVDVRFTTFANTPQLVVQGKLLTISTDSVEAPGALPNTPGSYYLGRVVLTELGKQQLGGRQLQAGMPVEVIIKTGERSVLKYLLHPIIKRMASSMIEE